MWMEEHEEISLLDERLPPLNRRSPRQLRMKSPLTVDSEGSRLHSVSATRHFEEHYGVGSRDDGIPQKQPRMKATIPLPKPKPVLRGMSKSIQR
jgi:hypothetical protein